MYPALLHMLLIPVCYVHLISSYISSYCDVAEEYNMSEADVLNGLKIHPLSSALLRERANFLWNVRKHESKKAYQDVCRCIYKCVRMRVCVCVCVCTDIHLLICMYK